jgi:hypothetical protein
MGIRSFHPFDQFGNRNGGVKACDYVNVVFNPTDPKRLTSKLDAFGRNASMDSSLNLRRD